MSLSRLHAHLVRQIATTTTKPKLRILPKHRLNWHHFLHENAKWEELQRVAANMTKANALIQALFQALPNLPRSPKGNIPVPYTDPQRKVDTYQIKQQGRYQLSPELFLSETSPFHHTTAGVVYRLLTGLNLGAINIALNRNFHDISVFVFTINNPWYDPDLVETERLRDLERKWHKKTKFKIRKSK